MQGKEIEANKEHGFIKVWRSIRDWEYYTFPETTHLFLHLVMSANWINKQWRGYTIERGQYVTSIEKLSKETGLTFAQVRTSLDRLRKSNDIITRATNKNTWVTIVKYDHYQDNDVNNDKPIANQSQTNRKPIATTKEVKEKKEIKRSERVYSSHSDFILINYKNEIEQLKKSKRMPEPELNNFLDYFDEQCLEKKINVENSQWSMFKRKYGNWYTNYRKQLDNEPPSQIRHRISSMD